MKKFVNLLLIFLVLFSINSNSFAEPTPTPTTTIPNDKPSKSTTEDNPLKYTPTTENATKTKETTSGEKTSTKNAKEASDTKDTSNPNKDSNKEDDPNKITAEEQQKTVDEINQEYGAMGTKYDTNYGFSNSVCNKMYSPGYLPSKKDSTFTKIFKIINPITAIGLTNNKNTCQLLNLVTHPKDAKDTFLNEQASNTTKYFMQALIPLFSWTLQSLVSSKQATTIQANSSWLTGYQNALLPLYLIFTIISLLIGIYRVIVSKIWQEEGEGFQVLKACGYVIASVTVFPVVVQGLQYFSDGFSGFIISTSAGGSDNISNSLKNILDLKTINSGASVLFFIFVLIAIPTTLFQLLAVTAASISLMYAIIIAPLYASADISASMRIWWSKIRNLVIFGVCLKPMLAILYSLVFMASATDQDQMKVTSILILGAATYLGGNQLRVLLPQDQANNAPLPSTQSVNHGVRQGVTLGAAASFMTGRAAVSTARAIGNSIIPKSPSNRELAMKMYANSTGRATIISSPNNNGNSTSNGNSVVRQASPTVQNATGGTATMTATRTNTQTNTTTSSSNISNSNSTPTNGVRNPTGASNQTSDNETTKPLPKIDRDRPNGANQN